MRKIVCPVLGLLLTGAVWVLIPSIVCGPCDPYIRRVTDGLIAYRAQHGRDPDDLAAIKPSIDAHAGVECAIGRIHENRFAVVLLEDSWSPRLIEVDYAATPDGELQTYTARMLE